MTTTTIEQTSIMKYLTTGAENARTARELSALIGGRPRDITRQIETERRDGAPIIATCGINPGYYLASTREELQHYCIARNRRESHMQQVTGELWKTAERLPSGVANGNPAV